MAFQDFTSNRLPDAPKKPSETQLHTVRVPETSKQKRWFDSIPLSDFCHRPRWRGFAAHSPISDLHSQPHRASFTNPRNPRQSAIQTITTNPLPHA